MKVNGGMGIELLSYVKQLQQQHPKPGEFGAERSISSGSEFDKVHLSDRAREVHQAFNMLKQMPDVREAKVSEIRMDVERGTYRIIAPQVAGKMLSEAFENNMILQKVL
jgi:negative regulator of flagellin synthesis FlgM